MTNPYLNITKRFPLTPLPSAGKPIFVLSTIWRSGSTLLQRTLVTDRSIQMWGEPYADTNLIRYLSQSAIALTQSNWPPEGHFPIYGKHNKVYENPEKYFIANWYPPMQSMYEAHRAMLDRLFRQTAIDIGKERFGVKFVRIGIEEKDYLEWLYPDAKFIILVRNPWDCWRSYKGYDWTYRWPKGIIRTPKHFASLWKKQTSELIAQPPTDNVTILRYEDFVQKDFRWDKFKEFCELPNMNSNAFNHRLKGWDVEPQPVIENDCKIIGEICQPLTELLGYRGLKDTDLEMSIGEWRQQN